ncbi:phage replisome organizer N-terminal domain-containing protein [Leuconostoc sp. UCMA20149]|uniref:phage replisome organizer N-terminal domain-containing protein n=1 Tax=Leuconostoc sp. UCMA20149 TaxID=2583528 RepID=UPI0025AFF70F|nr:phage replisome organizer N-terminal domain-containing protein [Leuconostoc sp. UCMA20149]MDN2450969.1 DnaD domain protein [Leuconostoc sp. UCMA20149]
MAEEKNYFWIKIRQDFFTDPYIKLLRRMAGGDTYTIIYLEMLVKSADTNGTIYFQGAGSDIAEELALMLNENVEDVRALLAYLEAKKLMTHPDLNEDIYLVATPDLTGSETGSARRVREFRKRQKEQKALQSNTEVTNSNNSKSKSKNIELEQETKKEPTAYQKIVAVYEKNGFGLVSPIVSEKINDELKDFASESSEDEAVSIITKAMEIAALNSANNFNYVLAITKKWYNKKLFTLKAVEADELKNKSQKSSRYGGRRNIVEPQLASVSEPVEEPERELPEWLTDAAKDL